MRMVAGTSCAMATRPTSKMTVANIISRTLKPLSRLRRFVSANGIPVSFSRLSLANPLPGAAGRSGPNLYGAGGQQNHSTIAEVGVGRAAKVEHVGGQRQNRATRIKSDGAVGTG